MASLKITEIPEFSKSVAPENGMKNKKNRKNETARLPNFVDNPPWIGACKSEFITPCSIGRSKLVDES
jgi:hypothetical protein